jgi:hypothetical protein
MVTYFLNRRNPFVALLRMANKREGSRGKRLHLTG